VLPHLPACLPPVVEFVPVNCQPSAPQDCIDARFNGAAPPAPANAPGLSAKLADIRASLAVAKWAVDVNEQ
jgi:hypothetical protein